MTGRRVACMARGLALTGACWWAAGGAAMAAPVDYRLTPTHSFVHFEWMHAGLSTLRGRFDKVSGQVRLDRPARQGQGQIDVRLDSVNTGRPALDAALRQALFNTGDAPARFAFSTTDFEGDAPSVVRGELRSSRFTMPIELRSTHFNCYFNPLLRREVCGGEFDTQLMPAALGLDLQAAFGLAGPIRLRVQVEAIRQEATP